VKIIGKIPWVRSNWKIPDTFAGFSSAKIKMFYPKPDLNVVGRYSAALAYERSTLFFPKDPKPMVSRLGPNVDGTSQMILLSSHLNWARLFP